ncbi:MAG: MOSC domain-containing protein [Nocardioidaceae bacterium]
MRVTELWRYPVKSLQGEQLDMVEVTSAGLRGDRSYAIVDTETGLGLTARRVPELLFAAARLRDDGLAEITLPDGSVATDDDALSRWLERRVSLRSAKDDAPPRYENVADFEQEATSAWEQFEGGTLAFHDSPEAVVSLLSYATITGWAPRRFRANLLFDGVSEETLVGSRLKLGDAELDIGDCLERCVMVTRPQPEGIDKDLDVLRTIHRQREGCLAVGALVATPGTVHVGDELIVR